MNMIDNLKNFIENSGNILITSHIGPDGDSLSSSILLYKILSTNYPDKKIYLSMEEKAPSLSFINGYDETMFKPLAGVITEFKPELMIILDANTLRRVSRTPEQAAAAVSKNNVKLAVIDHHEPEGKDESDIYINQQSPAVAQDICDIFLDKLALKKPEGYAQVAIVGIYTDTGGFVYRNLDYKKTFSTVAKLLEDGADIESVVNELSQISEQAFEMLQHLMKNTDEFNGFTYSYIEDALTDQYSDETRDSLTKSTDFYRSFFLRNLAGRSTGFIVYRDMAAPKRMYSVSFRSQSGDIDVSKIAGVLGGGGHKPAAAAKIECGSIEEAVQKAKDAISSVN